MAERSQALKEAYASAPPDAIVLMTLELRHPSFDAPVRVVANTEDLTLTLEADAPADPSAGVLFVALPFALEAPAQEPDRLPEATVAIDNVSAEIGKALEAAVAARAPVDVTYREWLADDPSAPAFVLHGMTLARATATPTRVTGSLTFLDLVNLRFPRDDYTIERFPGLAA